MQGRTYRYFAGEPLYPFGHGLSYTRFEYADLRIDPPGIDGGGEVNVSLDVKNSGTRAGHEVVQLYARAIDPKVPMPIRQLCAFERVWLEAGESRRVTLRVAPARAVGYYDTAGKRLVVAPGEYEIGAGASSKDIRLSGRFSVR